MVATRSSAIPGRTHRTDVTESAYAPPGTPAPVVSRFHSWRLLGWSIAVKESDSRPHSPVAELSNVLPPCFVAEEPSELEHTEVDDENTGWDGHKNGPHAQPETGRHAQLPVVLDQPPKRTGRCCGFARTGTGVSYQLQSEYLHRRGLIYRRPRRGMKAIKPPRHATLCRHSPPRRSKCSLCAIKTRAGRHGPADLSP